MKNTLEMMKLLVIGYEKDLSVKELVEQYKKEQQSNIIAYMYCSNYGLITKVSKLYHLLDEQEIASLCLQELDKTMINFDTTRQCNFITYFILCFKNRLRAEEELLRTHLRFSNYCTDNIDDYIDIEDKTFSYDVFDIDNYSLTNKEKQQCKLLIAGYKIKDIAKHFNVTVQSIYTSNKNIGKKLLKAL